MVVLSACMWRWHVGRDAPEPRFRTIIALTDSITGEYLCGVADERRGGAQRSGLVSGVTGSECTSLGEQRRQRCLCRTFALFTANLWAFSLALSQSCRLTVTSIVL